MIIWVTDAASTIAISRYTETPQVDWYWFRYQCQELLRLPTKTGLSHNFTICEVADEPLALTHVSSVEIVYVV